MELPLLALKFCEDTKVAFRLERIGVSFPEQIQKFCLPQLCCETFEFCAVLVFQAGKELQLPDPLHFQQFCRENGDTPGAGRKHCSGTLFPNLSYFGR